MKKFLALVLAMTCAATMSVPALALTSNYDWNSISVSNLVDEDGDAISTGDTIRPGQTVYYRFGTYTNYDYLLDSDLVKTKVDKDVGSKYIANAEIVTKKFDDGRFVALKVEAKDNFTADEMKAKIDVYITARKQLKANNAGAITNGEYEFPSFDVFTGTITEGSTNLSTLQKAVNDAQKVVTDLKATQATLTKEIADLKASADYTDYTKEQTTTSGGKYKYSTLATDLSTANSAKRSADDAWKAVDDKIKVLEDTDITVSGSIAYFEEQERIMSDAITAIKSALGTNTYAGTDTNTYNVTLTDIVDVDGVLKAITEWPVTVTGTPQGTPYTKVGDDTILLQDTIGNVVIGATTVTGTITDYDTAKGKLTKTSTAAKAELAQLKVDITPLATAKDKATNIANELQAINDAGLHTTAQGKYDAVTAKILLKQPALDLINDSDSTKNGTLAKANTELATAKTNLSTAAGGVGGYGYLKKGEVLKVPLTMWIQNEKIEDDDFTFVAGEKGIVIKPVKNELNTVTWEDNNSTLAIVEFTADSSSEYFMPRLSTKWDTRAAYDEFFPDGDAYIRSYDGNPYLPATSRARLWITNPFMDDDESYVDMEDIYVYELVDGELREPDYEITTNPDDDDAFLLRTRRLGTYIFSDTPAEIEEEEDDDYLPEDPPKVDIGNNAKPNPGTGI